MALITLGVISREEAINMDELDGRTREGKFRDKLLAFGSLLSDGTDDMDLEWLAETFKGSGISCESLEFPRKGKKPIYQIAESVHDYSIPVLGVDWEGGSGHWLIVVGYQGFQLDDDDSLQVTHLLCLDPSSEAPRVSLWNSVIEVFQEDGEYVNEGRYYCKHWGGDGYPSNCRIVSSVIVNRDMSKM